MVHSFDHNHKIKSVKFSSCEEFYRQQYMESLEIVVNMLQNRFTQKNFKL
jgi:hypothetical protein